MVRAACLIAVCAAGCGLGMDAPNNNGLSGSWSSADPSTTASMVLSPGPNGVSGTANAVLIDASGNGHAVSYQVSTLPNEQLEWKLVAGAPSDQPIVDFIVHVVPFCLGDRLPDAAHTFAITLGGLVFLRSDRQLPSCDTPGL
jgi:hypothetical protein